MLAPSVVTAPPLVLLPAQVAPTSTLQALSDLLQRVIASFVLQEPAMHGAHRVQDVSIVLQTPSGILQPSLVRTVRQARSSQAFAELPSTHARNVLLAAHHLSARVVSAVRYAHPVILPTLQAYLSAHYALVALTTLCLARHRANFVPKINMAWVLVLKNVSIVLRVHIVLMV